MRIDRLVRMYRDARGRELARLMRLAEELGVPEECAKRVYIEYAAYRITYEEAVEKLKRLLGR